MNHTKTKLSDKIIVALGGGDNGLREVAMVQSEEKVPIPRIDGEVFPNIKCHRYQNKGYYYNYCS